MAKDLNRRWFLKGLGVAAAGTVMGRADSTERSPAKPIRGFTFAFFTDVHLGGNLGAPKGTSLAFDVINRSNAEFAICGGDHIFDGLAAGREALLQQYALYTNLEKRVRIPVRHVLGNHDVAGVLAPGAISETDPLYGKGLFRQTFDTPTYYSFLHGGVRFIVLDSIQIAKGGWEPRIDDAQIAWLRETLLSDPSRPVIVVSHVPLTTGIANYYPGSENTCFHPVANSREIVPLLERHNVIAVLQGHTHIVEDVKRHGIHYITGGAVSGNWWHGSHFGDREGVLLVTVEGGTVKTSYVPTGFTTVDPINS